MTCKKKWYPGLRVTSPEPCSGHAITLKSSERGNSYFMTRLYWCFSPLLPPAASGECCSRDESRQRQKGLVTFLNQEYKSWKVVHTYIVKDYTRSLVCANNAVSYANLSDKKARLTNNVFLLGMLFLKKNPSVEVIWSSILITVWVTRHWLPVGYSHFWITVFVFALGVNPDTLANHRTFFISWFLRHSPAFCSRTLPPSINCAWVVVPETIIEEEISKAIVLDVELLFYI